MIYMNNHNRNRTALEIIENSPFMFYLTGSRFFNTATEKSDWDFFVEQCEGLQEFLAESGFHITNETYAQDPMFTAVWAKDNVHVQIVRSATAKQYMQDHMHMLIREFKPSKQQVQYIWAFATKMYRGGMEASEHGVKSF